MEYMFPYNHPPGGPVLPAGPPPAPSPPPRAAAQRRGGPGSAVLHIVLAGALLLHLLTAATLLYHCLGSTLVWRGDLGFWDLLLLAASGAVASGVAILGLHRHRPHFLLPNIVMLFVIVSVDCINAFALLTSAQASYHGILRTTLLWKQLTVFGLDTTFSAGHLLPLLLARVLLDVLVAGSLVRRLGGPAAHRPASPGRAGGEEGCRDISPKDVKLGTYQKFSNE